MRSAFKGKTCTYCLTDGASSTGDHVFARKFVALAHRGNLPQVPACDACNGKKAELEHYLTAVLPFGARHPDASAMLRQDVPRRLAKNLRLHRELGRMAGRAWVKSGGMLSPSMTIPIEADKITGLFAYIVRGLARHHWAVDIPLSHHLEVELLSATGDDMARQLLGLNGRARLNESLGNGALQYEAVQAVDDPALTIWRFVVFGGVVLGGDPASTETTSAIWATSGPKPYLSILSGDWPQQVRPEG